MDREMIKGLLTAKGLPFVDIEAYEELGSTNTVLEQRMGEGCAEWHTVIAEGQSDGRGRLGRSFFSPRGTGLYMSIALCPSDEKRGLITGACAVALCEAFEKFGLEPGIKWVNDIFTDNKKVCGILARSLCSSKGTQVILGIGVNVYRPENGFPEEIANTAGYLFEKREKGLSERLCAEIIARIYERYNSIGEDGAPDEYRKRCLTTNRPVRVIPATEPEGARDGFALYVDNEYRLTVEYENGERETLFSGEVSVKI